MIRILPCETERLGLGSRFLGSGGGESCFFPQHLFETQTDSRGVQVINVDGVDDFLVAPIVCLGSDVIIAEKNFNFVNFVNLFKKIEQVYAKKIDAIAALSVGGGTVFVPAFLASYLNKPLLDADCFGRTFPELQMMSTHLAGIPPKKAFIANVMGDVISIECNNYHTLERHARRIAMSSGGRCLIVPQVLTGEEAKRGLIAGTLTQALKIGEIIQETHSFDALAEYTKGRLVGIGGIMSIQTYGLPAPFKRRIVIKNTQAGRTWDLWMENEFNLLFEDGKPVAEVPDIITLCDPDTCAPLTIQQLYCNANVAIFTMKAPDIWYNEKGLALVQSTTHLQGRKTLCAPQSASKKVA